MWKLRLSAPFSGIGQTRSHPMAISQVPYEHAFQCRSHMHTLSGTEAVKRTQSSTTSNPTTALYCILYVATNGRWSDASDSITATRVSARVDTPRDSKT